MNFPKLFKARKSNNENMFFAQPARTIITLKSTKFLRLSRKFYNNQIV